MAIRLGRDGKAIRDANARPGELAIQLAERGILAPDERDVAESDVLEPLNERRSVCHALIS
jgi:hypothetical protein